MARYRLRILHISDLHLKGGAEREAWRRVRVLGDRAWADNLTAIADEGPIDLVCFTGDVAFSGKADQYGQAADFFGAILARFGLDWERFFVVPGNHDVDRDIEKPAWKRLRGSLIKTYPETVSSWIRGENPPGFRKTDREALLSRQACYREWLKSVERAVLLPDGKLHPTLGYRVGWRPDDWPFEIHIIGLDSAWLAGDDDDAGKLRLTDGQVGAMTTEPTGNSLAGFRIALVHHPLDDLADGAECRRLLADRVDLLLRGHLHEPEPSLWADPDRELRQIAAGCLYEYDKYPNACHVLDIELNEMGRPLRYNFRFRGWSSRGGFWFDDPSLYKEATGGRLTVRLVPEPPDESVIDDAFAGPYRLQEAGEDDIQWIVQRARKLYGETDSIPLDVKLSWFNKNPHCFWIIKNASDTAVGSFEILPLKDAAMEAFKNGHLTEKEITSNDIYGANELCNVKALYIENFMAINDGNLPNQLAFCQCLDDNLDAVVYFLTTNAHLKFYAMPLQSFFAYNSDDILVNLGFRRIGNTKQGYPLYDATGARLLDNLIQQQKRDTYRLQEADKDDVRWIVEKARELYGETDSIPLDVKLSWFDKNPHCFWIITNAKEEIVGSFEILPLKEAAMKALKHGELTEKEITSNDIYGANELCNANALYVENVMAIDHDNVPNQLAVCRCLGNLNKVFDKFVTTSANLKFYAMPIRRFFTKNRGLKASNSERILVKLGFYEIGTTKQGYPLYYATGDGVLKETESLLNKLQKRCSISYSMLTRSPSASIPVVPDQPPAAPCSASPSSPHVQHADRTATA